MMPAACAASSACVTSTRMSHVLATDSPGARAGDSHAASDSPTSSSITRYARPSSVVPKPNTSTMLG